MDILCKSKRTQSLINHFNNFILNKCRNAQMQATTIPTAISCEATHLQSNAQSSQVFEQMWANALRSFKDEVRNPCTFTRLHISIWLIFVFGLIDDTMWTIRIILRREHCAAAALCNSLTIERPVHMWERRIDLLTFSIWMKATFMSFKFISIRGGSSHHLGNWLAHQASNVYVTIRKSDHWPNCDEYGDAHADDVFAI